MRSQRGFTYLVALFAVAATVVLAATALERAAQAVRREREADLLFVGMAYRQAIGQYYEQSPGALKRYPPDLTALLDDVRQSVRRRPLRRLYADPLSGRFEWGLIPSGDGGVMGVYPLSERRPLKTGNFPPELAVLASAETYRDWQFIYLPARGGVSESTLERQP